MLHGKMEWFYVLTHPLVQMFPIAQKTNKNQKEDFITTGLTCPIMVWMQSSKF